MESLKDLLTPFKDCVIKNKGNPKITGICSNSKKIQHGDLYVAIVGQKFDGRDFIEEAIKAGAKAVITDLYNPLLDPKIPQVITKNPGKLAQELALKFYERPSILIGVTGTNGKTTVTYLVKSLLDQLDKKTALIGTCEIDTLQYRMNAKLTTPDGIELCRYMQDAKKGGAYALAMEVSSHALDQKRILGVKFDIALFTNLTHDHLDYHKTFEAYKNAKGLLFSKDYVKKDGLCVFNIDDPVGIEYKNKAPFKTTTYSLKDPSADLHLSDLVIKKEGTFGKLCYQNSSYDFYSPLIGKFNASNALCAVATALHLGFDIQKILEALKTVSGAKGRLEKVTKNIIIDFAHTPDGLESVLSTLKEMDYKKVHVLFGCGGDRDRLKRPKMAEIAQKLADVITITSDNPRTEDPLQIIEDIKKGLSSFDQIQIEVDRKLAIQKAIQKLKADEILVLCGKGHEKSQIIGHIAHEFDEEKIVKETLKELI
jgi:UDP-N-acetylmuramoyl-L-alanyl-D-glutamate--2,6-diaminopimelate ligase